MLLQKNMHYEKADKYKVHIYSVLSNRKAASTSRRYFASHIISMGFKSRIHVSERRYLMP